MNTLRAAAILIAFALSFSTPALAQLPPTVENGWAVYRAPYAHRTVVCDGRPVYLAGRHTSLRLTGDCHHVRVAGEHNDIFVQLASGGIIEITGAHNDVTWTSPRGGMRPRLVNEGYRNTFHAGGR